MHATLDLLLTLVRSRARIIFGQANIFLVVVFLKNERAVWAFSQEQLSAVFSEFFPQERALSSRNTNGNTTSV